MRGLDVNPILKAQAIDIKIIQISSLKTIVDNSLCNILNAVEYEDILSNVNIIKTCLTLEKLKSSKQETFTTQQNFISLLNKFLIIPPKNNSEYIVLEPIIDLVIIMIENDKDEVSTTITTMFEKNQINLAAAIRNSNLSISFYSKISKLIIIILKFKNLDSNVKITLFEDMLMVADACFKRRQLEHEKQALLVLTSLSSHYIPHEVRRKSLKKLFHLTVAVKTMTQMSSKIQKLSLISITNLLSQTEEQMCLKIRPNNIIYLSGLCSHKDFEIRNLAWCILEYTSKNIAGVNSLIETLQHLPGNFHSCCLTTMLDDTEVTMIRVTAGDVLANIISSEVLHRKIVDQLFHGHQVFKAIEGRSFI